jgi:hypothetical protein
MVPFNVRNHLCHSDWTAFQGLRTSMWYQRFPINEDVNLMTLMIDNGMLHEILPFPQPARDNSWTNEQRHVPSYRPYYARRATMSYDLDDIFDIGTTFIIRQPIRHIYTDLMIRSEEQSPANIPTPINLSIIMDEEESKIEQIFNNDLDDNVNLNDTLSIDLMVCPSCNRQCT